MNMFYNAMLIYSFTLIHLFRRSPFKTVYLTIRRHRGTHVRPYGTTGRSLYVEGGMEGKFHHFFINTLVKNGGGWGGVGGLNKCVRDAKISKVELTGIIKMTSYIKQGVLLSSGGGVEKKRK